LIAAASHSYVRTGIIARRRCPDAHFNVIIRSTTVIPLHRTQFPNSKAELAEAMDAGLRPYVRKTGPIVTINARVFPYLDQIAISFDGAELDPKLPKMPQAVGETKLACEAGLVTVSGRNISIEKAPLNLQLTANDVVFHQGRDENGEALLLVNKVGAGHFMVSVGQLELENAIREMAQREAAKHGISIEETRVSMRARGSRSIAADIRLRARKFLFRTNIDISGQVDIDDQFNAKISNLKCRGDGTVGSLACGVLEPHLRRLEGKGFPLMSFPLGEVQLRDVRIAVADTIEITADFGTPES